jgi:hypothetical protein
MKNLIALLMVCGFAFAFVACGGAKTESTEATDSVATEAPADTTAAPADSTAADTTAAQ